MGFSSNEGLLPRGAGLVKGPKGKSRLCAIFGVGLLIILATGWEGPLAQPPQAPGFGKSIIIRIEPGGVFPPEVTVSSGTTIIWVNGTRGYVTVVFYRGGDVAVRCQAPTRFFLAPDGTYTSNAYPPGAVASLACLERGEYRYFVSGTLTVAEGGETNLGVIHVR